MARSNAEKHNIRKGVEVEFADGEVREIRPLTIKPLRKFVKALAGLSQDNANFTEEDLDAMSDAALIVLEYIEPGIGWTKDEVEDVIDLQTFGKLMAAAMGSSSPEA